MEEPHRFLHERLTCTVPFYREKNSISALGNNAILFSVKWDSTSKALVEESMRFFHNSNQRITGLVLSQIDEKGMKRYGYGGDSGAFAAYGKGYYDN